MPDGKRFDPERHATLGDWRRATRNGKDYARCLVQPAKKSEQQGKTEFVFFPEGDGITDGFTAVERMLRFREEMFGEEPDDSPLFRFAGGAYYEVRHARTLIKESGRLIDIDPSELGAQSARIGGATDLMVTDCGPALLQVNGRWVSTLGITPAAALPHHH